MYSKLVVAGYLSALITPVCSHDVQIPLGQHESFISRSIFGRHSYADSDLEPRLNAHEDLSPEFPYQGISYFAHLNGSNCFVPASDGTFDIGIVGAPFDLGVSYRPGARFGPTGARLGSRRLSPVMGYDMDRGVNPFTDWASVVDCGDIANSPFDKLLAIHQLEQGWTSIASRTVKNKEKGNVPRIISIGGDHTISLPAIRALYKTWGRVAVLHFDSHLDSWDPHQLGGGTSAYADISHGSMFHILHEEGLLSDHKNMHLGLRTKLLQKHYDLNNDARCGFSYIRARELDTLGIQKVIERIVNTVKEEYIYLSIDVDVMDPAFTPATGTIEPGGWTTREMLQILSGLAKANLKIVGADVVEFSPIYDNKAETTAITVSEMIYEILQWMIHVPVFAPSK